MFSPSTAPFSVLVQVQKRHCPYADVSQSFLMEFRPSDALVMSELRVSVQKRLFIHIMCLHEVKAGLGKHLTGGSFLKGTQSRGFVIIGHMVLCVLQQLEMKKHFFFINAGPVSLLDFTHRPSFTIEEGSIIKTKCASVQPRPP